MKYSENDVTYIDTLHSRLSIHLRDMVKGLIITNMTGKKDQSCFSFRVQKDKWAYVDQYESRHVTYTYDLKDHSLKVNQTVASTAHFDQFITFVKQAVNQLKAGNADIYEELDQ